MGLQLDKRPGSLLSSSSGFSPEDIERFKKERRFDDLGRGPKDHLSPRQQKKLEDQIREKFRRYMDDRLFTYGPYSLFDISTHYPPKALGVFRRKPRPVSEAVVFPDHQTLEKARGKRIENLYRPPGLPDPDRKYRISELPHKRVKVAEGLGLKERIDQFAKKREARLYLSELKRKMPKYLQEHKKFMKEDKEHGPYSFLWVSTEHRPKALGVFPRRKRPKVEIIGLGGHESLERFAGRRVDLPTRPPGLQEPDRMYWLGELPHKRIKLSALGSGIGNFGGGVNMSVTTGREFDRADFIPDKHDDNYEEDNNYKLRSEDREKTRLSDDERVEFINLSLGNALGRSQGTGAPSLPGHTKEQLGKLVNQKHASAKDDQARGKQISAQTISTGSQGAALGALLGLTGGFKGPLRKRILKGTLLGTGFGTAVGATKANLAYHIDERARRKILEQQIAIKNALSSPRG